MVLQHSSVGNPYIGINLYIPVMACQCRDFPQRYAVIPSAIVTSNLFHNFYHLDPYSFLKLIASYI